MPRQHMPDARDHRRTGPTDDRRGDARVAPKCFSPGAHGRVVPEYLTIATVLAPWGIHGEAKVRIETDFPDRFTGLSLVYLGPEHRPLELEGFRLHGRHGLLKLRGYENPESVGELRGLEVQVPVQDAVPLGPQQYYAYQIEGLQVLTEDGEALGSIEEVLFAGGNAVYVTRGPRGEVLIPALSSVVLAVDVQAGHMTVRLPPGLLD